MSSEGGQAMSAAERRRQKILARGTERLKTITGQTTAEGAYVEAAAEVSTAGKVCQDVLIVAAY